MILRSRANILGQRQGLNMCRRILMVTSVVSLFALAGIACAKDPEVKVPVTLGQLTQANAFQNTVKEKDPSPTLPPLYFASTQVGTISTGPTPRLSSTDFGSLRGIATDFGATSPSIARFDLGLTGLASTTLSASVQPTFNSLPVSDNRTLATPSLLRDAGIGTSGTSQFVLPASYLNNGHQFLNR